MDFKTPKLEDKKMFDAYFHKINYRSADFSAATLILWKDHYHMTYAITEDMLIIRSKDGHGCTFSYPIGGGDEKKAVEAVMEYCREEGIPFAMHGILKETEEKMKEMFGDIFTVEYDRDLFDYIYERESLATLRGKKLHGKRNHINRFKENHDWSYESLNAENALEALTMLMEWKMANEATKEEDADKHEEICAAKNALMYYKDLDLRGGVLRSDGKIIAFAIGEGTTEDTFVVHFEKAFGEIQGAYPMINQQFILHEAMDYQFINREEDLGEEGLRKAKLSYRPLELLEKGLLKYK